MYSVVHWMSNTCIFKANVLSLLIVEMLWVFKRGHESKQWAKKVPAGPGLVLPS